MPDHINYITEAQLIAINKAVGETGTVTNRANLEFTILKIHKTKDLYKAASHLLVGIVTMHPFVDGNKRTALNALLYLLEINGKKIDPNEEKKVLVLKLIYDIVNNTMSETEVEKEIKKVIE